MVTPPTTPAAPSSGASSPLQLAGFVLAVVAIANVGFYFMSDVYYAGRALGDAHRIADTRIAFAAFSVVLGVAGVAALLAPRLVGHGLAVLAGLASLVAGVGALSGSLPGVLGTTLLVFGAAFPLLVWRSLGGSRAAWASLFAMCAVYAIVLTFGAPKVRGLVGIGLWTALIIPGLLAVAAGALHAVRGRYDGPVAA